jgi:hypothetical protein
VDQEGDENHDHRDGEKHMEQDITDFKIIDKLDEKTFLSRS